MRIAVFGPTAVGKSRFCLTLAQETGGEIVNADAVQVYRGFDLGSAKPAPSERAGVAHHLLDIADPDMEITVASYQVLAAAAIREIERRGHVPIVSGGSGLYLRAALGEWGAFGTPPDPEVRRWSETATLEAVYARAMALAPAAAARMSPHDRPRLVRIIERAEQQAGPEPTGGGAQYLKIGLQLPRGELYARIDERAAALWPHLLDETGRLLSRGAAATALAERTIGYREALHHLQGGVSADQALQLVQTSTRRLAKRQMTWWRREPNTVWLRPDDGIRQLGAVLSR